MDSQFLIMLLKLIIFLPFMLFIIYASLKFGGNKIQSIQNGKYIKILEKVPLSKENSLIVAKIGDKAYVLSSSNANTQMLLEVSEDDIIKIEASKNIQQYSSLREFMEKLNLKKGRER